MTDDSGNPVRRFRWKSGLLVTAAGITWIAVTSLLMPDRTFRIIGLYYGAAAWLLILLLWWLFFSAASGKLRVGLTAAGLAGGAVAWLLLVHRLEFDGAMAPKITWRWQAADDVQRDAWLSSDRQHSVDDPALEGPYTIVEQDWPRYCGADGSRIVREPLTNRDWTQQPPRELWRHPVGDAWSSFAVAGPRLYTQEQRGDDECIVCYHTTTGQELWIHRDTTRYETGMGGIGPRATPTVTDTALYAVGATGLLTCLNPITGAQQWQRRLTEDADTPMPMWGYSCSPLLRKNTVIVVAGGAANRAVLAYDRDTGDIVWGSGSHHPGYSSPRIETIGDREVLLIFHGDGLAALDPDSGQQLWEYPMTNMYQVNVAQPILVDNRLFVGTGYDGFCVAVDPFRVTENRPAEAWAPNRHLNLKFNEAVAYGGYVFGLDDGILCCLDPATGKRQWKSGRYNFGQLLLWDDVLLVQAEKGYVALVAATPDRFQEITRFPGLQSTAGRSTRAWNVPVVNRSRLFLRSDREAACFEVPQTVAD